MSRRPTLIRLDSEGPILDYQEYDRHDEAGLRVWADFCATCYADKAEPPKASHFYAHFRNDPFRDFSKIYVAMERQSNTLCGTVRVLRRRIWCSNRYIDILGIADVCTLKSCRFMGVGNALLKYVLETCKDVGEHTFLLHANEKFHSFYSKLGFHMLRSHWSVISPQLLDQDADEFRAEYTNKIIIVDISRTAVASSAALFASMSETVGTLLQLQGTLAKTTEYVKTWVASAEILDVQKGGKFYCICDRKFLRNFDASDSSSYLHAAIGYVIAHPSVECEGKYKIDDLGILPLYIDKLSEFVMFFADELRRGGADGKSESKGEFTMVDKLKLEVPSSLGVYLSTSGLFDIQMSQVDNGFMIVTEDIEVRDTFDSEFTFWPVDSF